MQVLAAGNGLLSPTTIVGRLAGSVWPTQEKAASAGLQFRAVFPPHSHDAFVGSAGPRVAVAATLRHTGVEVCVGQEPETRSRPTEWSLPATRGCLDI